MCILILGHRVSIMQIFNYIMKKGNEFVCVFANIIYFWVEWLQQTRISLSLFDVQGLGYLKESVCKFSRFIWCEIASILGFRKLHFGVNSYTAPTELLRGIISLILCLYSS